MSKLDQLVSLFPGADYPLKPCIETVRRISEIDKAITGEKKSFNCY